LIVIRPSYHLLFGGDVERISAPSTIDQPTNDSIERMRDDDSVEKRCATTRRLPRRIMDGR
jgi:hypothetical protein